MLDLQIDALDLCASADCLEGWLARRERAYVCHVNVHGVMEAHRDPRVRDAYARAGLAVADGMPLVWLGRRAGHAQTGRVYGPDLMLELCARAARAGYASYYLGGTPGVAEELAAMMERRFPGLRTAGTCAPPFLPAGAAADLELARRIDDANPDIVWVGLGCPKQELWMAVHRPHLRAPLLVGVGAAFDFHTGRVRQAPPWMQRAGLEWLFRLLAEPRRLWKRYLVYNTWFVALLVAERLGLRPVQAEGDGGRTDRASQASTTDAAEKIHNDTGHPGGR